MEVIQSKLELYPKEPPLTRFLILAFPYRRMPNTTGRIKKSLHELVGEETVASITDYSQLMYYRPIEKWNSFDFVMIRGYVVNWDHEAKIWRRLFDSDHLNIVS